MEYSHVVNCPAPHSESTLGRNLKNLNYLIDFDIELELLACFSDKRTQID